MRGILTFVSRVIVTVSFVFTNMVPLQAVPVVNFSKGSSAFLSGVKLKGDNLVFFWKDEKGQIGEISDSQTKKVLSYFYSALAIPDKNRWVDLFVLNTDQDVMGPGLEWTELGYTMIDADLRMKVKINELMDPDNKVGAELWGKLADLGVSSFMPRFWMVPGEIKFYSDKDSVYIRSARIDVKVEVEDKGLNKGLREEIKKILKETIVPVLGEEINKGPEFAELRKVYYSMILASWVKRRTSDGLVSDKLANIIDSYVLPDVGTVKVDRWAFLREFNRHFLFGKVDGPFVSVMGGGEDFKGIVDKLGSKDALPGDPNNEGGKDGVKATETDIPEVTSKGGQDILENKAAQFGIDPKKNVVGIFGDVEFDGVSPENVIGLNVVLINLSNEPLKIDRSFVDSYGGRNQFFGGVSNLVIARTQDGKILKLDIPSNELKITKENAVAFLDTVAKVLFQKRKLIAKFNRLEKVGLFFSQRLGEEVPEDEQETIKERLGESNAMFVTQNIPSSSTRVREGRANHLVTDTVYAMLRDVYFPRWSAYEDLKEKEKKGTITEGERERLRQIEDKMDEQSDIAVVLLDEIEKAITSIEGRDYRGLSEVEKRIDGILKNGIKLGQRKILLDGYGIHLIGSDLVRLIEGAIKDGRVRVADYLMKLRRQRLYNYSKKLVQKEYFTDYEPVDSTKPSAEQINLGRSNMKEMVVNNARTLFGIEVDPITLEPRFDKKVSALWDGLKGKLPDEEDAILREIKDSKDPRKLSILANLREKIEEKYKENAIYQDLKMFLDVKEMELAYLDIMETFNEIKKNVKEGKVSPKRKDLRIAYLPMKGDPWQLGHIWVIAKLLATGKVDKVIVTVDNGDPRKPKLSDGMVRGPISEVLLNRIFGDFVEFSTLPFDRSELFEKTGEETIVHLVDYLFKEYAKEGRWIKSFYYVAGSDHAKFLNLKKITKEQDARNKEIKKRNVKREAEGKKLLPLIDFEKEITEVLDWINENTGLKLSFDYKQGILVIPSSNLTLKGPADELGAEKKDIEANEEKIVQELSDLLGISADKILKVLAKADKKAREEFLSVLGTSAKEGGNFNFDDRDISSDVRDLINHLRKEAGLPVQEAEKTPARPGGLLLSKVSIR